MVPRARVGKILPVLDTRQLGPTSDRQPLAHEASGIWQWTHISAARRGEPRYDAGTCDTGNKPYCSTCLLRTEDFTK